MSRRLRPNFALIAGLAALLAFWGAFFAFLLCR